MSNTGQRWQAAMGKGGPSLDLEVGRVALQAQGAVLMSAGRAVVLVTAGSQTEPAAHLSFFPLTVEYREKMASAGRIPGSFMRREARAANHEILTARLVDRSIRPHFPDGFRCETQVFATVMSFDADIDAAAMAITGASAALTISPIPWGGPVAGVRVARIDGELKLFPAMAERKRADLDLVVSVTREGLVMVEGSAGEVAEEVLIAALEEAQKGALPLLEVQEQMRSAVGREKRAFETAAPDSELVAKAASLLAPHVEALFSAPSKRERSERTQTVLGEVVVDLASEDGEDDSGAQDAARHALRDVIRDRALAGQRLDGRGIEEVRPISGEVAWLQSAHGSSLFSRGETQAVVTCTLGTGENEQLIEDLHGVHKEAFLLHYNFPPYSVGEVRPMRGPSRRDIGHGTLARWALRAVLPEADAFPFTIRVESEITSSNGSSSMATVCGGSLALMDAGVPIREPVAGIAMGLIASGDRSVILTDILGDEDHLGDMDFKVAGTAGGITAVQLDNKLGSLPREVLARALEQARKGRLHILEQMRGICPQPRAEPPAHAPRVLFRQIRPARIRDLIGPGGRHIKSVQSETGVKVDVGDDGRVRIYGPPGARLKEADQRVHFLTGEPRVGGIYRGRVAGVTEFGCFVELFHGIDGLVHVSDLDTTQVEHPSQVATVGEEMVVKVLGASPEGKIRLSRKEALGASDAEIEG